MNKFGFTSSYQIAVLDFFLLNLAYFLSNFAKQGTIGLSSRYMGLLFIFYLCWLIACFGASKFKTAWYSSLRTGMVILVKSTLYMGYCVTFIIVFFGLHQYSRLQIFLVCLTFLLMEILVWSVRFRRNQARSFKDISLRIEVPRVTRGTKSSFSQTVIDLVFVLAAFFAVNFFKRGTFALSDTYELLLMIILGLWVSTAIVTDKFSITSRHEFYFALWQWLKAGLFMLATISVVVYGFRLFQFSRFQAYGTILVLMLIEMVFLKLYYEWLRHKGPDDIESIEEVQQLLNQEELKQETDLETIRKKLWEPVRRKLEQKLGREDRALFEFIDRHIDLNEILCMETASDHNSSIISLTSDRIPIRLFLNLEKINDTRRLNKYFLDTHKMLIPGGIYVGRAHTIKTHRDWIYSKFPKEIARYVYMIDFLFTRVMPKLPGLQKIYFAVTKGKNRVLSRAEVLGRLCFCGFDIVAEKDIEHRLCFIARKAKTPAVDENPTYGPLVALKRVGYNNDIVPIYKLRTMHPYSEYLQKYLVEKHGLQKGGKLENDFRLTTWGKFARRLWIDELPMLYNWLRGDLQLVGVRPLSVQYFSMYDQELKELRKHVKPGLVPPYYADLPVTLEEISDSEKRYIRAFLKHPVKTQWKYFWKAFYNIVFKGARSQ